MKTKIGIIGYGEIGKALESLYTEKGFKVFIRDIERDDGLESCVYLHIAIPYSSLFVETVISYIQELLPDQVIIHSTVAVGTTKEISKSFPNTVHSPVRGVHPNLLEGLKTFTKVIAGKGVERVNYHFKYDLELDTQIYDSPNTTEAAKLLDTSYYGVCIAWHHYCKKICDKVDANYDQAMTQYNKSYNEGYRALGMEQVVRPVLYPPKDKIGGHCIIPNAELLLQTEDSSLLREVINLK